METHELDFAGAVVVVVVRYPSSLSSLSKVFATVGGATVSVLSKGNAVSRPRSKRKSWNKVGGFMGLHPMYSIVSLVMAPRQNPRV